LHLIGRLHAAEPEQEIASNLRSSVARSLMHEAAEA
jgi:hypothetical protein